MNRNFNTRLDHCLGGCAQTVIYFVINVLYLDKYFLFCNFSLPFSLFFLIDSIEEDTMSHQYSIWKNVQMPVQTFFSCCEV